MGGTDDEIDYAGDVCSITAVGPVYIVVVHQPATAGAMGEIRRRLTLHTRTHGDKSCTLSVLSTGSMGVINPGVREEASAMAREVKSLGAGIVIEGSGFAAAAARTILSGISLIGHRSPQKVFKTLDEGAKWISNLLAGAPSARTLIAAVDSVRSAR
jgi:hypothetical protein